MPAKALGEHNAYWTSWFYQVLFAVFTGWWFGGVVVLFILFFFFLEYIKAKEKYMENSAQVYFVEAVYLVFCWLWKYTLWTHDICQDIQYFVFIALLI